MEWQSESVVIQPTSQARSGQASTAEQSIARTSKDQQGKQVPGYKVRTGATITAGYGVLRQATAGPVPTSNTSPYGIVVQVPFQQAYHRRHSQGQSQSQMSEL